MIKKPKSTVRKGPQRVKNHDPKRQKTPKGLSTGGSASKSAATKRSRPIREDLVLQAALEAYGAIRHEGRLSDRALDFTLRRKKTLHAQERRAVSEHVYALLRRQRTVDWLLEKVHQGAVPAGATGDLLRLATARILCGDSEENVRKAWALPEDTDFGLSFQKALMELPRHERLPISASLPDFLAELLLKEFGDDAEQAVEALNQRAPLTLRTNTLKTKRENLQKEIAQESHESRPTPLSPLGLAVGGRPNVFAFQAFKSGLFEVQDEGSQLLGFLVDPPPTKIIDACAGAGGKTLQLSAAMKNRGDLLALDVDEKRIGELKKRARRAGVHNVRTQLIDPDDDTLSALANWEGQAHRVLVDAPCSGTGSIRRKPDARYRLTEDSLWMHVKRQKTLISRFAKFVKPGGDLIYGTCSLLRAENEDVVRFFLEKHPDFELVPVLDRLPEGAPKNLQRDGCLRLYPHIHGTDGFFAAILKRKKS